MILFTSAIDNGAHRRPFFANRAQKAAVVYGAVTLFVVLFSFVYHQFSHEVTSFYMTWAALFPFVLGFLPFLFYEFLKKGWGKKEKQDALKYLMIYDVPEALRTGIAEMELTMYDAQKLKQLCRKMAWHLLVLEDWVDSLEMQNLIMESLDTDLEILEQEYQEVLRQIPKGNSTA